MLKLEEELKGMADLVELLRNESGRNSKKDLLEKVDAPHKKEILQYTYNPFLKYGVSRTTLEKLKDGDKNATSITDFEGFKELLNELAENDIRDYYRTIIANLLSTIEDNKVKDLIKCILSKDLKVNVNDTLINQVYPNLIPSFEVMLGKKYSEKKKVLEGKNIIVTEKIDGVRCIAIVDSNKNVKFYSRQGKEMKGLEELTNEIKKLDMADYVLDGELIIRDESLKDSKEKFKATTSLLSSKIPIKNNLTYNIFDYIDKVINFYNQSDSNPCSTRKDKIKKAIENSEASGEILYCLPIMYEGIFNEEVVNTLHSKVKSNDGEGLMINLSDAPYQFKRTDALQKVKEMFTCDLKIIGFEQGAVATKYENTLGALIVDYKGNPVGVGSGYTDAERNSIWHSKKELLGRVIEVQYFEETVNEEGLPSLRFPVFVGIREKGKEVSYD